MDRCEIANNGIRKARVFGRRVWRSSHALLDVELYSIAALVPQSMIAPYVFECRVFMYIKNARYVLRQQIDVVWSIVLPI